MGRRERLLTPGGFPRGAPGEPPSGAYRVAHAKSSGAASIILVLLRSMSIWDPRRKGFGNCALECDRDGFARSVYAECMRPRESRRYTLLFYPGAL